VKPIISLLDMIEQVDALERDVRSREELGAEQLLTPRMSSEALRLKQFLDSAQYRGLIARAQQLIDADDKQYVSQHNTPRRAYLRRAEEAAKQAQRLLKDVGLCATPQAVAS